MSIIFCERKHQTANRMRDYDWFKMIVMVKVERKYQNSQFQYLYMEVQLIYYMLIIFLKQNTGQSI